MKHLIVWVFCAKVFKYLIMNLSQNLTRKCNFVSSISFKCLKEIVKNINIFQGG